MKHSKGEWLLDEQGEGISISIYTTERPETIVTVWSEVERLDGLTHEEAKANAKLVLAAPDLLNALLTLLKAYREVTKLNPPQNDVFTTIAHNAISKAITI